MKFTSRSAKARQWVSDTFGVVREVQYASTLEKRSQALPGVWFTIYRMSFSRRMELCRRIRELSPKLQYVEAGTEFLEKVEANLLGKEIEALYLRWGLHSLKGLSIDGEPANAETLIERGPEGLASEIVAAIQAECSLTEAERKN